MGSSSTGLAAATKATDVETYRKKEIVAMVVEETGLSKADAGKAVDAVLESIVEVRLVSILYSFQFHRVSQRTSPNPHCFLFIQTSYRPPPPSYLHIEYCGRQEG